MTEKRHMKWQEKVDVTIDEAHIRALKEIHGVDALDEIKELLQKEFGSEQTGDTDEE